MATTEISIKANLTQLRKELALIPGITDKEAKAMSQELIKQLKKSEKAAKSAAGGSKKAWQGHTAEVDKSAKAVDNFTDSAGDADSTLMGFAGVLDLVNPALGDMARVSGDALAGAEAVGKTLKFSNPIFLALAAAAVVLGGAYVLLTGDTEEAEEAAKSLREEQKRLNNVLIASSDAINDSRIDLLVATGALNQYEASVIRAGEAIEDRFKKPIDEATAALAAAKGEVNLWKSKTILSQSEADKFAAAISLVDMYRVRLTTLRGAIDAETTAKREAIEAGEDKDNADKASVVAAGKAADALERQKEAAQTLAASEQTLSDIITTANADKLSAMDSLENALQAQLDLIDLLMVNHADNAELMIQAEEAKAAAIQNTSRARYKLLEEQDEEYAKSVEDRQKEQTKNNEKHIKERTEEQLKANAILLAAASYSIGAISDLESQAAAWSARLAEEGEQQNLAAAKAAFNIAKAAALAGIAVNTAGAIMKITEQTGVFAPPLVAITAALGLSQAALVASEQPSFHAGGLIGHGSAALNPDERSITARAGEGVVSQSGMARLGAGGLDSLNRGTGGGGQIIVTQQYQHRAFGAMVQRDIQLPNSPLRKALRGTGRVGHKSRSN